jgi:flagellar basal-body rod modification protein FlgD
MTTVNPPTAIDQILSSVNQVRTQTSSTTASIQDRFLKLLITQMQNQDPLNPMDNAEVTSQLAQISTVSGIDKLNTTIAGMTSSMVAAQSLQAGSLIGHAVLAPGKTVLLQQGQAVGGVQLSEPADQVTVTIANAAGQTIKTLNLGAQDTGTHNFGWDGTTDAGGKAGDGSYTFAVSAMRAGQKISADALGYGLVQSVTLGGDQLQLNTYGLGPVALGQVKQIL